METSSYTRYLPAVLSTSSSDPNRFLGRMLQIFEQLLTGIRPSAFPEAAILYATKDRMQLANRADADKFVPGDVLAIDGSSVQVRVKRVDGSTIYLETALQNEYGDAIIRLTDAGSIASTIDKLPELFDPWKTPANFLPWIASWLALTLEKDWSEYQQRKFISEILSIYRQRGLKQGLLTYLDIYAANEERPRIAIDAGEAVYRGRWMEDASVHLHPVAYSRVVEQVAVLLHPAAIAVDRDNHYIIADQGGDVEPWPPSLWKLSATGDLNYRSANSKPVPQPIYSGDAIENPVAVAVDRRNRYYVLSIGEIGRRPRSSIQRFDQSQGSMSALIDQTTNPPLPVLHPVDMVLDESAENLQLFILDRGSHRGRGAAKLVIVRIGNTVEVEEHLIPEIIEPTALIQDNLGRLIVSDAKEPARGNSGARPADLIRIDPTDDWAATSLLESVPTQRNPLIFPTGLAFENRHSLLLCDTGVRRRTYQDNSNRHMAEPAALYRIDLKQDPPAIARISDQRRLVDPTKLTIDQQGDVVICDRGAAYDIQGEEREWRARSNEFGVVVLFSQQRPTGVERRNQIRFDIARVIDQQKPGHSDWWMKSL